MHQTSCGIKYPLVESQRLREIFTSMILVIGENDPPDENKKGIPDAEEGASCRGARDERGPSELDKQVPTSTPEYRILV